jgi:hypothetical protein
VEPGYELALAAALGPRLAAAVVDDLPAGERLLDRVDVNRVLDRGAVVTGEVTISVAGVDLIYLGLQLVLTSVENIPDVKRTP